jgi:3-oxoacyl-[acyl-carrier protein] reductase
MLLKDKVAVVYGVGAVGGAVAKAFAREGARVFLGAHDLAKAEKVAKEIGSNVEPGHVDALDKKSVDDYLAEVVKKAGRLDISFNAIGWGDAQGVPFLEMTKDHFAMPVVAAVTTHFLTGTAAARHMSKNKSGVILAIAAQAGKQPYPNAGGFGVACSATEGICRQMATEFGPLGIRVICLRSSGSPDAPGVFLAWKAVAESQGKTYEEFASEMADKTLLKRGPMLADVANAAAMLVSDYANGMTAAIANITCGEVVD